MKLFRRQKKIEEPDSYDLPNNTEKWQWWYEKCGTCRKYHRLNFASTYYFTTMDGWDSDTYVECWKCRLKDKIRTIKYRIKRKIKQRKEYRKWIKRWKQNGIPITKELKETTRRMCQ